MSNKRKPRPRPTPHRGRPVRPPRDAFDHEAVFEVLHAADAAEARGDAAGALAVLEQNAPEPDGMAFWRPWRLEALRQLEMLGPAVPPWAYSRWVLAQALQALGRRGDPVVRRRQQRALDLACELRGGLAGLPGVDDVDRWCRVFDHDWAYRQLFLYDFGGLTAFLDRGATRALLARADDLRAWARRPLSGYRLLGASTESVLWWDLADGSLVSVVNTGCAAGLAADAHVLGRVVPTRHGPLFETRPLPVPPQAACRVAEDPTSWVEALHDLAPGERTTGPFDFELLSDLGLSTWRAWLTPDLCGVPLEGVAEQTARRALDLAHRSIRLLRSALEDEDDHSDAPAWPVVAAALTSSAVSSALPDVLTPGDRVTLDRLVDLLPDPAATLCAGLAAGPPRVA